jgi:hypothetical protein
MKKLDSLLYIAIVSYTKFEIYQLVKLLVVIETNIYIVKTFFQRAIVTNITNIFNSP